MVPEESNPGSDQPASTAAPEGHRPGRRSGRGRGRRGRGRGRAPRPPQAHSVQPPSEDFAQPEFQPEPRPEVEGEEIPFPPTFEAPSAESAEPPVTTIATPERPSRPAPQPSVQRAIEEVNHIVEALREALDDMEGVLEMLEVFERQELADERELESLRRALRQLQRPREGGPSHRGRS